MDGAWKEKREAEKGIKEYIQVSDMGLSKKEEQAFRSWLSGETDVMPEKCLQINTSWDFRTEKMTNSAIYQRYAHLQKAHGLWDKKGIYGYGTGAGEGDAADIMQMYSAVYAGPGKIMMIAGAALGIYGLIKDK